MPLPFARTFGLVALCAVSTLTCAQEVIEIGSAAATSAGNQQTTNSKPASKPAAAPTKAAAAAPQQAKPAPVAKAGVADKAPVQTLVASAKQDTRPDILSILPSDNNQDDPMLDGTAELAFRAVQYLGIPYRRGGTTPAGFDCSGLVRFVFGEVVGMTLPRRAEEIVRVAQPLKKNEDLEPGDLVFYNTMGRRYSHVGIYLGNNRFVHAPSSGGVVRIESMDLAYWKKRFNGAGRIDVAALSPR